MARFCNIKKMKKAVERAAKKMSSKVKNDADFQRKVHQIQRCMTRDELMVAFLNERMAIDPVQVFRVLQLTRDK